MAETPFIPGQKWISTAEPELGIGQVLRVDERQVHCYYDLAGEERTYARRQAPLVRARFSPDDQLRTLDGIELTVTKVVEKDGILVYHGDYLGTNTAVMETEIDPRVTFSQPQERLFTGQLDEPAWFELRYHTLLQQARLAADPRHGLHGPRVSLIPHQLYIANEVATRFAPRVLLADEVGLGKTIEAGLIMHQQLHTGRAERILVVVPPALTFQWFVEMIRRFNLRFTVMDNERAGQIEADNAPMEFEAEGVLDNPFDAQQLVLTSLDLFTEHPDRLEQAVTAGWDLVVVDEAHHLTWTPEGASAQYKAVEALSAATAGLLLLTATPEQLGQDAHFARLRLLDPSRFYDLAAFRAETAHFADHAAHAADLLDADQAASAAARDAIRSTLGAATDTSDDDLLRQLLDRHGTGRVFFRNVRGAIRGFPARRLHPVLLTAEDGYGATRFFPEDGDPDWLEHDPRVAWLRTRLSGHADKHLIICANQQTAIDLEHYLSQKTVLRTAVFHEGMDLVSRDRAANYFAETEAGAQALICSEIGSEGRNFQFASHLVLFDLPALPDLLEQRIGRLDRIGQGAEVHLHVPLIEGSLQSDYFRWFHEGMNLFAAPNPAGQLVFDELHEQFGEADIEDLIKETQARNQAHIERLERGRDRLVELNSNNPALAATIVDDIESAAHDPRLEAYMERSFDCFGLESEPLGDGLYLVRPTEQMVRHTATSAETMDHFHYPELPEDGIRYTFDREAALAREDVAYFTWENPLVRQAMDTVLGDITGNSTMIAVKHPQLKSGTLLVETLHVVTCHLPAMDRYLPGSVIRSVITPAMSDISEALPVAALGEPLSVPMATLAGIVESQKGGIRRMLKVADERAAAALEDIVTGAASRAGKAFRDEVQRLSALKAVNPNVRGGEIEYFRQRLASLDDLPREVTTRLDAIRVIVAA